jgi:hypothetical protein
MSSRAVVAVALTCLATSVRAVAAPPASPATPPNLEVVIVGEPATADLLSMAIAPLLTELQPVAWRQMRETTPVSDALANPGAVRVWVDARRKGRVTVVGLSRSGAARVRSAEVPGLTPVEAETVAQIVHETAVALCAEPAGAPTRASAAPVEQQPDEMLRAPARTRTIGWESSLALGYVTRDIGPEDLGKGVLASATLWYEHESLRSFVTLGLDWVRASAGGGHLDLVSLIPALGISWRLRSALDLRTAIGGGGARYSEFGGSGWLATSRATVGVASPLGARLEMTLAFMVDGAPRFGFSRLANYQPGAMLAVGWRP